MQRIEDHADRAAARLLEQLRDKPRINSLVRLLAEQVQALEDALHQLYTDRTLETAVGAQLDVLGALVGQARQSYTDEEYRTHIRARIRLNLSSGTIPDLIAIFRTLVPAPGTLELFEHFPAGLHLRIRGIAFTPAFARMLVKFLRLGKAAGVHAVLEWQEASDAATFTFNGTAAQGFGDVNDPAVGGRLAGAA